MLVGGPAAGRPALAAQRTPCDPHPHVGAHSNPTSPHRPTPWRLPYVRQGRLTADRSQLPQATSPGSVGRRSRRRPVKLHHTGIHPPPPPLFAPSLTAAAGHVQVLMASSLGQNFNSAGIGLFLGVIGVSAAASGRPTRTWRRPIPHIPADIHRPSCEHCRRQRHPGG